MFTHKEIQPDLLPPADEVWGKVIFSQACVKNSVHRGRAGLGGVPGPGRGVRVWRPPMMAIAAGGMHPTGMHSCYSKMSVRYSANNG